MSIAPTTVANNAQLNAFWNSSDPLWQSQARASLSFFFKYDLLNGAVPTLLNNYAIFRYPSFVRFSFGFGGNTTTTASLSMKVVGSAGTTVQANLSMVPGTVYHVAATWDSVAGQVIYLNAIPAATGTVTGTTQGTTGVGLHLFSTPANGPCSLSDLAIWHGYALTQADVTALRDAAATPATLATPAAVRFTFAGTVGATPARTDAAMKNSISGGITTADFTASDPGWAGTYSAPLAFTPGATISPVVTTCGSLVRFTTASASGGVPTGITAVYAIPTIRINGVDPGPLIPLLTPPAAGPAALYRIPGGWVLTPSDVATWSAPIGAYNTGAGLTAAASNAPVTNCVGRSTHGADTVTRTFKAGMNFPWTVNYYAPYCAFANLKYRISQISSGNGTIAPDGTITITSGTQISSLFLDDPANTNVSPEQVNAAYPAGYYAIQYDDLDPANPTTVSVDSGYKSVVTEDVSCRNAGSGGVGKGGAWNYAPAGVVGQTAVIRYTCPTGRGKIANLWISPPWDYSHTPGVPVSLDRSDPLRIDSRLLARFPNGLGSVRCIDSTFSGSGLGASESEPEHMAQMSSALPSVPPAYTKSPGLIAIRPWDPAVTGYLYNGLPGFGSPYPATLGAAITDTGTIDAQGRLTSTITITDAATAPVMVGLTLRIDDEDMGVLAVSGTSVTVRRGSRASTPATHATGVGTPGSASVYGRQAMNFASFIVNAFIFEVVSSAPHGLRTGPIYTTTGAWPASLVDTNGHTFSTYLNNGNGLPTIMVTGPDTFLIVMQNVGTPITTVASTTALDPAATFLVIKAPTGSVYPIELIPALANALGANAHVGVPIGANDDMVDAIARRVRDVMTPGRSVQVEFGDEPWNVNGIWNVGNQQTRWHSAAYGTLNRSVFAYHVDRQAQIVQRFKDRFDEGGRGRGGEVKFLLNQQFGGGPGMMNYAGSKGYAVDTMAIAPYIDVSYTPVSLFYAAQVTCSDAELVDLMGHCTWYTTTFPAIMGQAAIVANFNATYGRSATLYGYEGGDQYLYAVPVKRFGVVGAVGAADTTITLAAGQGAKVLVGDRLLLLNTLDSSGIPNRKAADEWVLVTAISGDALTVTRGQPGGAAASAHASPCYARTNWIERTHDAHYHPNWAIYTNDFHLMLQMAGMVNLNHYAYTMPWPGQNCWGVYTNAYQMPGKGDGTDGLNDNRTCLATPGQAHTLPATTVQDAVCVSTRGYAINQWNSGVATTTGGGTGGGGTGGGGTGGGTGGGGTGGDGGGGGVIIGHRVIRRRIRRLA